MFEAAHDAEVDPDRGSFVAALRITGRSLSQARDFPRNGGDAHGAHVDRRTEPTH
jgi:hypothetical protein